MTPGRGGRARGTRPPAATRGPAAGSAYAKILAVVRRIPRGRVATYGQVATLAGYAHAPRLAGYALHALPDGSPVPWHRVLGAGGRLSLGRLSLDGALTQRIRLEAEGVTFDARGRARLDRHAWAPGRTGAARRRAAAVARPRANSSSRAGRKRR